MKNLYIKTTPTFDKLSKKIMSNNAAEKQKLKKLVPQLVDKYLEDIEDE